MDYRVELIERQNKIKRREERKMFILTMLSAFSLLVSISFLFIIILALVLLVLVLAAFGTSLNIREMYDKGLLKVFEYATNIKQQNCEELLTISKILRGLGGRWEPQIQFTFLLFRAKK